MNMASTEQRILDAHTRLKRKQKEADKLLIELTRSLAIRRIWPSAFAHGSATSQLTGNCLSPDKMLFTIKDGAGNKYSITLEKVPRLLLDNLLTYKSLQPRESHAILTWWNRHAPKEN